MTEEEVWAWVWAPPLGGQQVFAASQEECRTRLEDRRRFFGRLFLEGSAHLGSRASFLHVAGTNGKGSVCAMLEACLSSLPDKRVGVFTSPHVHTARERIRVNGQLMDKECVAPLVEKARAIVGCEVGGGKGFNFFDKLFLLALLYFEEKKVDYVVLETGMGGRWDPTNVIERKILKVSIITSISMDHQEVLGDSLEQIAKEKAGIIKPGVPAVTMASQAPEALSVLQAEALLKGTSLTIVDTINEKAVKLLNSRLEGDTQRDNVTLAVAALHLWLRSVEPEHADVRLDALMAGLPNVYHPCRFELFQLPLCQHSTVQVVIDGGHNEDGLRKMFSYARKRFPGKSIVTVFGCGLYEKKYPQCLRLASQQSDRIALVVSSHFKSVPVSLLRRKRAEMDGCPQQENEVHVDATQEGKPSVADGIKAAIDLASSDPSDRQWVVIVCGSLFVAADGRSFLASLIPFPPRDWVHHQQAEPKLPTWYK